MTAENAAVPSTSHRTQRGSTVTTTGKHRRSFTINFDWFEEGACIEAKPDADFASVDQPMLTWQCDCCNPGSAPLQEVMNA